MVICKLLLRLRKYSNSSTATTTTATIITRTKPAVEPIAAFISCWSCCIRELGLSVGGGLDVTLMGTEELVDWCGAAKDIEVPRGQTRTQATSQSFADVHRCTCTVHEHIRTCTLCGISIHSFCLYTCNQCWFI